MFETLQSAPPDAILGLNEAYKGDPNPDKINLSVGVYKDADGKTPILECVKEAEKRLLDAESTKSYLSIDGAPEYGQHVQELLFGADANIVADGRVATVQAPGGTGALRVAADFVVSMFPSARIWCSQPTWANHPNIFQAAGLNQESYPYTDAVTNELKLDEMLLALQNVPAGNVVLLHACCHNPSGIDPNHEQWQQISKVIADRQLLPLVDFAYQGFGDGLREDARGIAELCRTGGDLLISSSFSKNFGLYRERVGALTVVSRDAKATETALSQIKRCIRANYSNPPAHGAAIVNVVLSDAKLRSTWEQELATMRKRIHRMRMRFVEIMKEKECGRDFSFITRQRGMFSFSGLTPEQVDELRETYSIYIVRSGRINVAGMTESNVERLCDAIASVL